MPEAPVSPGIRTVRVPDGTAGRIDRFVADEQTVDDDWAMVGSANLDNRSLHLNFEIACLLYSSELVAELARQYERDLEDSIPLDPWAFGQRSFAARLVENACRLFSPIL